MVRHILQNFLTSEAEYDRAVDLWRAVIEGTAEADGQKGEWLPWRPNTFVNGTPIPRDGAPIIDANCRRLNRAVTIMQHPPESDAIDISAWITDRDWREREDDPRTEDLTISLALSEESLSTAKQLIAHWMDAGTSRERMEDLIRELLPTDADDT